MKLNNQYYTYAQLDSFMQVAASTVTNEDFVAKRKIEYVNIPCAFDIETSSFYEGDEKRACCYCWQFGFNGLVIIGRNLRNEFPALVSAIATTFGLSISRRLICYVHNLSYEFQWIRKMFTWTEIMANNIRQPFKAVTSIGVEFRCSYLLSSYGLEIVAKNLRNHNIRKLTEKMDYDEIRHSETQLTNDEISYAVNDVLIVMAYISEEIEVAGGAIYDVPLTNTGRVRNYCKKNSKTYKKMLRYRCTLSTESYIVAKKAFQGGFTHANSRYVGKTISNVGSYDFTSSYPYVMVSEKFPMSTPHLLKIQSIEQFKFAMKHKCCIFQITFFDVQSVANDNFISAYRCENLVNPVLDNGRIFSAAELTTTITELDFEIIAATYKFSHFSIGVFYICDKDYLPLQFVQNILKLYSDKTTLKGVSGKELEYQTSKGMLNSCYGMCVTDIIRDEYGYDNDAAEWTCDKPDLAEKIYEYNTDNNRFLFYLWGVYVTAYARYNLITNIIKLGCDYVYADTDSIKFLNVEKNKHIFEDYNQSVMDKLKQVAAERKIYFDLFQPKTIKGVAKLLGVFDFEGVYTQFKTLGAKRYCYTGVHGDLHLTVAGVNKKTGVHALQSIDDFDFDFVFSAEHCGKLTHTYLDDEFSGVVVDKYGNSAQYHELSAIHLEKAEYHMTITTDYELFLQSFEGVEVTQL